MSGPRSCYRLRVSPLHTPAADPPPRRADMPPPVDIEELKREAIAARELMKGLEDDAADESES